MDDPRFRIVGGPNPLAVSLVRLLSDDPPCCIGFANVDAAPDASAITERCRAFADGWTAHSDAMIVIILPAARAGLEHVSAHQEAASLWAFTRVAALEWAKRGIRVNAIGLGASPAGPFEPQEQAGRAAFAAQAAQAGAADIARTIRAMAAWRSMTGQIIRLSV